MSLLRKHKLPRTSQHTSLANSKTVTEMKILKEIAIMKKLRHPHVVQLLEVLNDNLKEKIYMGKPHPLNSHGTSLMLCCCPSSCSGASFTAASVNCL